MKMPRRQAVLLGLLQALGKEVLRTKLVKLTYLLDNFRFEQIGQPMTDLTYHWDHYGPNAVGNAITNDLAQLSRQGLVIDIQKLTPYENYANYYKVADSVQAEDIPLTAQDWVFINVIVKRHGRMSREQIVRESKQTRPMQGARQYQVLEFVPNPMAQDLKEAFYADADFVQQTRIGMTSTDAPIDIEKLRGEVAKSTAPR